MSHNFDISRAARQFDRLRQETWRKRNELEQASPSDQSSCSVCKAIANTLDAPFNLRAETSLGQWQELVKIDCAKHRALFPVEACLINPSQEIILRKPARQSLLYVVPDLYRNITTRVLLEAPWEALRDRAQDNESRSTKTRPRIVDPDYIEIGILTAWLKTCHELHQNKCALAEFTYTSQARPDLLIDVVEKCLVSGTAHTRRYIALSYVWGSTNRFITTRSSVDQLSIPGALKQVEGMPRTIKETIILTEALGERYLWIDALCIIQDHESQGHQLNAMASIFANAHLTIVHADGENADTGFRGLRHISAKRYAKQKKLIISPHQQMIKPSSRQIWSGKMLAPWSTRAWTFQEEVCSRRVLYFAHDSVRWACRTAHWSEESDSNDCMLTYASADVLQLSLDSPKISASRMPQLSEYEALVNGFNIRALTFPEDALLAFAGVATRLGRKLKGGLISGLPEFFFDLALLWRPRRRIGPPLRRYPVRQQSHFAVLPSWSWAGWDTEITMPFTWNYTTEVAAAPPVLLGNIMPFYQIQIHFYLENNKGKTLINNAWVTYASSALSRLPEGWTARDVKSSDHIDYGSDLKYFIHSSDLNVRFWFPVPLHQESSAPRNPKILSFKTYSGTFKIGATRHFMTLLYALDDTPVGILWQHDESDPSYVDGAKFGHTVQLVAILGCVVATDDYVSAWSGAKSDSPKTSPPSRIKEVYAVLWIQWDEEGKVAYRRGTGQVDRDLWEKYADNDLCHILLA